MTTQPVQATRAPRLGHYDIDARHSAITFRTRHFFGLAPVRGAFTISSGTVDVAEPLAGSRIHAEIDAASFRTGNGQRDAAVRSGSLLHASRHPVITFDAGHVRGSVLAGELTVRDVTRPVSLTVDSVEPDATGSFTARARVRIDRTEFGITAMRGLAGRYLELLVEVQCVRR
ncbi:MAG TPA: YceI family protein [Streptosporangiaceae bacterium]|nr:YceI family protein [Streptosporangiaceae bacterium]